MWGERLSLSTATSPEPDQLGYIVINQNTAFFVLTNHRAQKVSGEGGEREKIDILKALYFEEWL